MMTGLQTDPRLSRHPLNGAVHAVPGPESEDFARATFRLRRELLAHCYRMLGSVHDAEDLVQEAMLRAWRSHADFDPDRECLRIWLYRIATNACLAALDRLRRRPLPSGLTGPSAYDRPQEPFPELSWLQPIPDTFLPTDLLDPAAGAAFRGGIRLAFVAALQYLPARRRAVLILRDVLAWPAAEVAALLDMSTAAVNRALQQARNQLAQTAPAKDDSTGRPGDPDHRELADRYVAAFNDADVDTLAALAHEDIVLEMPPTLTWFRGRAAFADYSRTRVFAAHRWQLVPANANGQTGFIAYKLGRDGCYHAHHAQVLTFSPDGISALVAFQDPSLFPLYGVARSRPAESFAGNSFTGL
jgi:RNA polymerase sigma-70 factor, ECF subfamily